MKRLAALLLLAAAPALAQANNGWQEIQNGWGEIQNVPVSGVPSGCVASSVALFLGSPVAMGCLPMGSALEVLRVNAAGTALEFAAGGGGITNGAGANVIPKSDGTNLVASSISEDATTVATTRYVRAPAYRFRIDGLESLGHDAASGAIWASVYTGTPVVAFGSFYGIHNGFMNAASGVFGWTNDNSPTSAAYPETFVRQKGPQNPAWGLAWANPRPYTHTLAEDASSADTSGANAVLTPGIGRGNAAGSTLTISTPGPAASGSTVQSVTTRVVFGAKGLVVQSSDPNSGYGFSANNAIVYGLSGAVGIGFNGYYNHLFTPSTYIADRDSQIVWSGAANFQANPDAGLARASAGVVKITDGSTGSGSLQAKAVQLLTASKPTCDSSARGTFWYVAGGAGVKDTVEVCGKDAADSYAWRTIFPPE